jgi:hypothetical protein
MVQQHLESWLAARREADPDGVPIPRHVERGLRGYLECGILACGFARARCGACGHDFLVAFSCKGRGLCPSCTSRRLAEAPAHVVEHVFPQVPVRQWVVTFPRRLRFFLHRDPVLLGRVRRCVLRAVAPSRGPSNAKVRRARHRVDARHVTHYIQRSDQDICRSADPGAVCHRQSQAVPIGCGKAGVAEAGVFGPCH